MSILYPLGLLALIGVPLLIFIYIIKNRYTEQTVSSTYLWTLSERFLKRRVPINRIAGILSLILQILAVLLIAIILAHPIISVPNAAKPYCFVLDGSGSMNIVRENGKTRFEEGKERIAEIIDDSMKGSTYTLIYAGNSTDTVFKNFNDKERAIEIMNDIEISYTANKLTDARTAAQLYFYDDPSAEIYLVTDRSYEYVENVTLIDVGSDAKNCAIADVTYKTVAGSVIVSGTAMSYSGDAEITLNLYFDDSDRVSATEKLTLKELDEKDFEIKAAEVNFASFKVEIAEKDALELDNSVIVYNVVHENISKTLLVSDEPRFVRAALNSINVDDSHLDVVKTEEYDGQTGYGLYIFDDFTPSEMPRDGSVWFINPQDNLEGSNFNYQDRIEGTVTATFSKSTATMIRKMLDGVNMTEFELPKYVKLGLNGIFTTLVTSSGGSPLIFLGTNIYGNREVVFAFDFNDATAFLFNPNTLTLLNKFMSYSFPEVIENTSYYCGEVVQINMIANCESIRIVSPLGKNSYPGSSTTITEYELTEVGTYKIYLLMKDKTERVVNVYSAMSKEERSPTDISELPFVLNGEREPSKLSGILDDLLILFIILAVIAVADYGVYCYEQYQLR